MYESQEKMKEGQAIIQICRKSYSEKRIKGAKRSLQKALRGT